MIGDSWIRCLKPVLQDKVVRDSRKRRSYSGNSVVDLLRFVRNMAHHFYELAPEVRMALGSREELGNYWISTFPLLLPDVHAAMQPFSWDTICSRIRIFYC